MFLSLFSGSSGNATLIADAHTTILVDCGLSGKRLEQSLASIGRSPKDLDAILVTHEHIDHTAGVGVISRRFNVPIFATAGTHQGMAVGPLADHNTIELTPGVDFEIGTIGIVPFSLSHDAADPVGFSFYVNQKKLSLATDTGVITETIRAQIQGSIAVILESNHDIQMLKSGTYPYPLQERIRSNHGHLSNDDCAKTAVELLNSGTEYLMLGHLSNENNTPNLAFGATARAITNTGATLEKDIHLRVARRYEVTSFL